MIRLVIIALILLSSIAMAEFSLKKYFSKDNNEGILQCTFENACGKG